MERALVTTIFDVVTVGETMAAFVGRDDPHAYHATAAGAESNVAVGVARLGLGAQWVSRLGDDRLGRSIEQWIGGSGVDVAIVRDRDRPTGVLIKHVRDSESEIRYYRSESAARLLSPLDLTRMGPARWIHVTGITPALSESAAELVESVVERRGHDSRVAFDVNYRPALWPDVATAAEVIGRVARRADLVFIGNDEAEALFGTDDPAKLSRVLLRGDDQMLVAKRGGLGASLVTTTSEVSQPALEVDVVDVTGAGDAFAAGFLAATCLGWDPVARLRLGHLMAARVVGVIDDVPPPFEPQQIAAISSRWVASYWSALDGI